MDGKKQKSRMKRMGAKDFRKTAEFLREEAARFDSLAEEIGSRSVRVDGVQKASRAFGLIREFEANVRHGMARLPVDSGV